MSHISKELIGKNNTPFSPNTIAIMGIPVGKQKNPPLSSFQIVISSQDTNKKKEMAGNYRARQKQKLLRTPNIGMEIRWGENPEYF